jgi:hypothetical protein
MGEEHGQVTALVLCKFTRHLNEDDEAVPCAFIGYESGTVAALHASLSEDGSSYNFSIQCHNKTHSSKVSAMTIVRCKSIGDNSGTILLSACYGGQVFYYPHAMNPNANYVMNAEFAFSNSHPDLCPILAMTSTTFTNDSEILVCTGDRDGR